VSRPARFRVHEGRWAVSKLAADAAVPGWAWAGGFASITRTPAELSVVCRQEHVPEGVQAEKDWACLELEGPMPFEMTGVLHGFLAPLAEAGVPIFAISTYDTDWVLVPGARLEAALESLERMMDSHPG
jgi:hypothetical protein